MVGEAPWIPDGVRVEVDEATSESCVTLIELEETKSEALISSRKYLPEDSKTILRSLDEYLRRKISECQSTADDRGAVLIHLRASLQRSSSVAVKTAWALRSSRSIEEGLHLIDQPLTVRSRAAATSALPEDGGKRNGSDIQRPSAEVMEFRGVQRLDRQAAHALSRCVLILDAVIRQKDHSGAAFHSWRPKAPLLKRTSMKTPVLKHLLFETAHSGIALDCESLITELVQIWPEIPEPDYIRNLMNAYFPKCLEITGHNKMSRIFETARQIVASRSRTTA
jgi:hypothetical protein